MKNENIYYVYLHVKLTDGTPFYVGKGFGLRYISIKSRNKHWHNIVNKYDYDVILLEDNLLESDALKLEEYWINRLGRKDLGLGNLVNHTNGGEGNSGRIFSEEHRKNLSIANKGRAFTEEWIGKMSKAKKGKSSPRKNATHTEDVKKILAEKSKGNNSRGIRVINIETGEIFKNIKDASISIKDTKLADKLRGDRKNNTNLRYYKN